MRLDLTGKTFGRLTVKYLCGKTSQGKSQWICVCICGGEKLVSTSNLRQGQVKSCGCLQKESIAKASFLAKETLTTHGMTGSRLSNIFKGMVLRCYNKNRYCYDNYGGRGITICDEWMGDRSLFFKWSKKNGYRETLTIDRIDNDKGYSPENCRWVTHTTQANNTRRNRIFLHEGENLTLSQIANRCGMEYKTLHARIQSGLTLQESLTKPLRKSRKQYHH